MKHELNIVARLLGMPRIQGAGLTILYPGHLSGLCLQQVSLGDEITSPPRHGTDFLHLTLQMENTMVSVFFCRCCPWCEVSIMGPLIYPYREVEKPHVHRADLLACAFAVYNKVLFSYSEVLCLLPAFMKQ